jgi:UTP--glucose-1-phosphate uridylyltransferase
MLSEALRRDMEAKGIDVPLSLSLLEGVNSGRLGREPPLKAAGIPSPVGEGVIDVRGAVALEADANALRGRLGELGLSRLAPRPGAGKVTLDRDALESIGYALLPRTAFGVLTGGSATSYVDENKNRALDEGLFRAFRGDFELLAGIARGKPKGLAPAYIGPAGKPGPSYLRLKQRALLLLVRRWMERAGADGSEAREFGPPLRPFHMPSTGNAALIDAHLRAAREDTLTAGLIRETGWDASSFLSEPQGLICAYTHSAEGEPRRVFDRAYGEADSAIALPGGHGQCFDVLSGVLRSLAAEGKRYAYLSNVDNLGALPSPLEIGIMAATGRPAGFDFSFRTPLDVKGGILIRTEEGRLSCGDIGSAISGEDVRGLESSGGRALFNCATGLFDLEWLVPALDRITATLPLRLSDQEKDPGRYAQAETSAWEVIGLMDDPLVFAVEKAERFLSAKFLMETILMSRAGADAGPADGSAGLSDAWRTGTALRGGLERLLAGPYGMGGPGR